MPELPEVETVVRGLRAVALGKSIVAVTELRPGTVVNHAGAPLDRTLGRIEAIDRRGKYILARLSSDLHLVAHLRMTGKFIVADPPDQLSSHTRAYLDFADGTRLLFHDPRTFGTIKFYRAGQIDKAVAALGPEPLSNAFDGVYLKRAFAHRNGPIKTVLLNQSVVAGVGNIYACEALYRAGIRPAKPARKLSAPQCANLVAAIKDVLNESLALGGTSISDYRNVDDKTGAFQDFLQVYGKRICPKGHPLNRIRQAGRSTYYCPVCQK
jgi:formamidopyrimidine-DNA glycosylase